MINMTKFKHSLAIGLLSAVFVLAPLTNVNAEDDDDDCRDCGVVKSIEVVTSGSSGVGAAAGAVAGGLAGNQVEPSTTSTLIGAAVGMVGGHYAEQAMGSSSWTVKVDMGEGDIRTLSMQTEPKVKVGDHVQVEGSNVTPAPAKQGDGDAEHHD